MILNRYMLLMMVVMRYMLLMMVVMRYVLLMMMMVMVVMVVITASMVMMSELSPRRYSPRSRGLRGAYCLHPAACTGGGLVMMCRLEVGGWGLGI